MVMMSIPRRVLAATAVLLCLGSGVALAQCPLSTNYAPPFQQGGNVFGSSSAQWKSYFQGKVDASNGTACDLSVTGSLFLNGVPFIPTGGIWGPQSGGTGNNNGVYTIVLGGSLVTGGALSIGNMATAGDLLAVTSAGVVGQVSPATAIDYLGLGTSATLNVGTSVNNPGTGTLEAVLPVQSVTGASNNSTQTAAWLFKKTRRSNSGSAMTDTFPASTATGMANGARIDIANVDGSATVTLTAGAGTSITAGCASIGPGRDEMLVYDLANTTWRGDANTCGAVLAVGGAIQNATLGWSAVTSTPTTLAGYGVTDALKTTNNLSDVANPATALNNLSGLPHIATIAALKALTGGAYSQIVTDGYYVAGDGGGSTYTWNGSSSASADGGSVIAPTSGSGRWLINVPATGLDARQFGVKFDNSTDNSTTLQAAFTWAPGYKLNLACGIARFGTGITFNLPAPVTGITVEGCGSRLSILAYTGTGFAITGMWNSQQNTARFSHFDMTTNSAGTASGILWQSVVAALGTANQPNNLLEDTGFYGADGGLATDYFATNFKTVGVDGVTYRDPFVAGTSSFQGIGWDIQPQSETTTGASGDGTTATLTFSGSQVIPIGTAINVSGMTPSGYNSFFTTVTASSAGSISYANTTTGSQTGAGTITACCAVGYSVQGGTGFQALADAIKLGNFVQTVTVNQTNIAAGAGIWIPANETSIEQVSVNMTDFVDNILTVDGNSCVGAVTITNNIDLLGTGVTGVSIADDCGNYIAGNTFASAVANTNAGTAINIAGAGATPGTLISGNTIQTMVTGLIVGASEGELKTKDNTWLDNTTNITNNSTVGDNVFGSPSIITFGSLGTILSAGTGYMCVLGCSTNEAAVTSPVPSLAYFDNLIVQTAVAPGGSITNTYTWRCAGVDTPIAVSITGSTPSGADTTHSASAPGGEDCDLHAVLGAGGVANQTLQGSIRVGINP